MKEESICDCAAWTECIIPDPGLTRAQKEGGSSMWSQEPRAQGTTHSANQVCFPVKPYRSATNRHVCCAFRINR